MRPYRDIDHFDRLSDELAIVDANERPYRRPSDFPSARAFLDFTDVTRPYPARDRSGSHVESRPSHTSAPTSPSSPPGVGADEPSNTCAAPDSPGRGA